MFQRPEVCDQGIDDAKLPLKTRKESFLASSKHLMFASKLLHPLPCSCITSFSAWVFKWLFSLCICLCLHLAFFQRYHSLDLGFTLIHYKLILTWWYLHRSYFKTRSHLQVLDGNEFWEDTIQPTTCQHINFYCYIKGILMM